MQQQHQHQQRHPHNYKGELQNLLQNPKIVGLCPEHIHYETWSELPDRLPHVVFVCRLRIHDGDWAMSVMYISNRFDCKARAEQDAAHKALRDQKQMLAVLTGRSRYVASSGDGRGGGDGDDYVYNGSPSPSSSPPSLALPPLVLLPPSSSSPSRKEALKKRMEAQRLLLRAVTLLQEADMLEEEHNIETQHNGSVS